ncbi:hypothetical protein GJW-30_1_03465 [Variibacter gotjawalensis]|uniref:Uncharacterized protein n=1 Tax=Variibacter gotjawalensis TaxID=1333996 RepID=A0A0S3PYD7_9BRAD|nr:hypothetical protein [Variibacter gotjawalensis]NIK46751.1 hypothetical protein [Variibacter gotjawalensis]RZS48655.1 hypothetical protein EV661_1070 [Variibacter gotjawalensis]BAT60915.1 hypothetical protein GJW-30_1_03465 [Variibacter gotjawalensis]
MRSGLTHIGFSVGLHAALLAGVMLFLSNPKPYASTPEPAIEVDVVTPEEAKLPEPPPEEKRQEKAEESILPSTGTAAAPSSANSPPPQQSASAAQTPAQPQTNAQAQQRPEQQTQQQPQQQAPPQQQPPQQQQQQPPQQQTEAQQSADNTPPRASRFEEIATQLRYGSRFANNTDFDAKASEQVDLTGDQISNFKAKLKSCWRLDPKVSSASRAHVVLRVQLNIDGRVTAEPSLIEASASADGPAVMRAAVTAVTKCAPFDLPRDRYQQWRVMDIRFTPAEMS